jgi:hypothetical protein
LTGVLGAVVLLGVVVAAMLLLAAWGRRRSARAPRIRPRRLPTIARGASANAASTVTVAGRTYNVAGRGEGAAPGREPCPWCLRSVGLGDPDAVVCRHPQCRRVAHRRCNKENDGCGGVCAVLG